MKTSPITPLAFALALGACSTATVPATVRDDPALSRVQLPDTVLHVVEAGSRDAPPVIVLHGGPGADHAYLKLLAPLADDHLVIWYDQRGTGRSARGDLPEGADVVGLYLDDLHALVQRYDRGAGVDLVGHSWGAMLASAYLGRHPERVRRVVLAEPGFLTPDEMAPAMPGAPGLGTILGLTGAWLSKWSVEAPDGHGGEDWFLARAMAETAPDADFCAGGPAPGIAVVRAGAEALQRTAGRAGEDEAYRRSLDFRAGVERYSGEVLFMAGACSRRIGAEHQRRLMRHFPRARLAVVEGAGHYLFNDQPRASVDLVRAHLEAP